MSGNQFARIAFSLLFPPLWGLLLVYLKLYFLGDFTEVFFNHSGTFPDVHHFRDLLFPLRFIFQPLDLIFFMVCAYAIVGIQTVLYAVIMELTGIRWIQKNTHPKILLYLALGIILSIVAGQSFALMKNDFTEFSGGLTVGFIILSVITFFSHKKERRYYYTPHDTKTLLTNSWLEDEVVNKQSPFIKMVGWSIFSIGLYGVFVFYAQGLFKCRPSESHRAALFFYTTLFGCMYCAAGIGVLKRNNIFRIAAIVLCCIAGAISGSICLGFLRDTIGLWNLYKLHPILTRSLAGILTIIQIAIIIFLGNKKTRELFKNQREKTSANPKISHANGFRIFLTRSTKSLERFVKDINRIQFSRIVLSLSFPPLWALFLFFLLDLSHSTISNHLGLVRFLNKLFFPLQLIIEPVGVIWILIAAYYILGIQTILFTAIMEFAGITLVQHCTPSRTKTFIVLGIFLSFFSALSFAWMGLAEKGGYYLPLMNEGIALGFLILSIILFILHMKQKAQHVTINPAMNSLDSGAAHHEATITADAGETLKTKLPFVGWAMVFIGIYGIFLCNDCGFFRCRSWDTTAQLLSILFVVSCMYCAAGIGILRRSNVFRIISIGMSILTCFFSGAIYFGVPVYKIGLPASLSSHYMTTRFIALTITILQIAFILILSNRKSKDILKNSRIIIGKPRKTQ
jgi:hypothetical protein